MQTVTGLVPRRYRVFAVFCLGLLALGLLAGFVNWLFESD